MQHIKAVAMLLLIALFLAPLRARPAFAAEGDPPPVIFITQVQITGGVGKTGNDFIELFNPGDTPVNLNGARLVKRSATGTTDSSIKSWASDLFIPAHTFYLWASSSFLDIAVVPDATTSSTLADNNGVALRFGALDTGTIIDSFSWGTSTNVFPLVTPENPAAGQAIIRADEFAATSTYAIDASNPRNSSIILDPDPGTYTTPYGTPYATPYETPYATPYEIPYSTPYATPSGAKTESDLVMITEILPNPSGVDTGQEKFELFNGDTETVDLSGWIVTDLTTTTTSSDAFVIAAGTLIEPGEYLAFTIPAGLFVLGNSAVDGMVLYFADQTQTKSVTYPFPTPDNQSWQIVNDSWSWGAPSLGSANTAPPPPEDDDDPPQDDPPPVGELVKLRISEIMPNPPGTDGGREWLELENFGTRTINLENFSIDTKKTGSLSANSFVLPDLALEEGERVALLIPLETISLPNNHSNLRLFDDENQLLEIRPYGLVPEGKTFSRNSEGKWFVTNPSPNLAEPSLLPPILVISELLPTPSDDQAEFIELQNLGSELDLTGYALLVNKRLVTLGGVVAGSNGLITIESDEEVHLNLASLAKVSLLSPFSEMLATVNYSGAKVGKAYASFASGYAWTETPTPGESNLLTVALPTLKKSAAKKAVAKVAGAAQNVALAATESNSEIVPLGEASGTVGRPGTKRGLPRITLQSVLFFGAASVSGYFAIRQWKNAK